IPREYWSVRPATRPGAEGQLYFRGAVLVHVKGRSSRKQFPEEKRSREAGTPTASDAATADAGEGSWPARQLFQLIRRQGLATPIAVLIALFASSLGALIEATLFRGLLELPQQLGVFGQRAGAMAAVLIFLAALLLLEIPSTSGLLRVGRHLEASLRIAFLEKIPRLGDRYFNSRLTSDMADRSHNIHRIRQLPLLGGRLVRAVFDLLITAVAIVWLDRSLALLVIAAVALSIVLPLIMQPSVSERDLRLRTHAGALGRFYLDALLGLTPIR